MSRRENKELGQLLTTLGNFHDTKFAAFSLELGAGGTNVTIDELDVLGAHARDEGVGGVAQRGAGEEGEDGRNRETEGELVMHSIG